MTQAFICDAIRTPFGRYGGALSSVRTDDLGAIPLKALMARNPNVDWAAVTDVSLSSSWILGAMALSFTSLQAVLYLAGDIHSNHWTGRIDGSPVVQALSSGAALGNIALKRHPAQREAIPSRGRPNPEAPAAGVPFRLLTVTGTER